MKASTYSDDKHGTSKQHYSHDTCLPGVPHDSYMLHLQHIAVVQERMRPGTEETAMDEWGFGNVRLVVHPFLVHATGKKRLKEGTHNVACR